MKNSAQTRISKDQIQIDSATLHHVHTLLLHLLEAILPLGFPRKASKTSMSLQAIHRSMDGFIGRLLHGLLLPIVQSLSQFSQLFVKASLKPSKKGNQSPHEDLRPELFSFVQSTFQALHRLYISKPSYPSHCRIRLPESIALEAARQLKVVVRDLVSLIRAELGAHRGESTTQEICDARIRRLGRKDGLWYLCSVIHVVFSVHSPGNSEESVAAAGTDILRHAIFERLSEVVSLCRLSQDTNSTIPDQAERFEEGKERPLSDVQPSTRLSGTIEDESEDILQRKDDATGVFPRDGTSSREPREDAAVPPANSVSSPFAEETFEDRFLDNRKEGVVIDQVSYNMILGVVERYWLWDAFT